MVRLNDKTKISWKRERDVSILTIVYSKEQISFSMPMSIAEKLIDLGNSYLLDTLLQNNGQNKR